MCRTLFKEGIEMKVEICGDKREWWRKQRGRDVPKLQSQNFE
jgi:hypothetical protein